MVEYAHRSVATGSNFKRAVALGLVVVVVASGCSLGAGKAGAKCPKVGNYASDGIYVLKCNARKRWERGITIAAGQALLNAALAANRPPPPTTTAVITPPITSFGEIEASVGFGAGQIKPGLYTTVGFGCVWNRYDQFRNGLGGHGVFGLDFALIRPTDGFFKTFGPCSWTEAPLTALPIPASGNAVRRVGIEIEPGVYRSAGSVPGTTPCTWRRWVTLDGSSESQIDFGSSSGPQLIVVGAGDAAFETTFCPPFVRVDQLERFALIEGRPFETITQGQRNGYVEPYDTIGLSTSAGVLTINFGGYVLQLSPPTGQGLATGVYQDVGTIPTLSQGAMSLSAPGRSCIGTSTFEIDRITSSGGLVTAIDVTFVQSCSGQQAGGTVVF